MTHQLQIKTGMGHLPDNYLLNIHYKFLQRFDQCWIVDVARNPNLSGDLAHPNRMPQNARYLGLLSHLHNAEKPYGTADSGFHLLVLLSGPEPQRSILSKLLWHQVLDLKEKVVFVEGSNEAATPPEIPRHISYHKRVNSEFLTELIKEAKMVICRSGYSTLMDLVSLGKKAILIPTPGQTEQEYLAHHMHEQGIFLGRQQKNIDLGKVLRLAETFPFKQLTLDAAFDVHKMVLKDWMKQI